MKSQSKPMISAPDYTMKLFCDQWYLNTSTKRGWHDRGFYYYFMYEMYIMLFVFAVGNQAL